MKAKRVSTSPSSAKKVSDRFLPDTFLSSTSDWPEWSALQPGWFPAFTVRFADKVLGVRVVADAQRFGIPMQALAREPDTDRAKQHSLGQRSGVIKVRSGFPRSATSVRPLRVVRNLIDGVSLRLFLCFPSL
ncbi:hypothetical protein Rcae01_04155 [Novipirellula caenicola]|uniref:Uncharacterized protein n=1 Tax=Novipirellula caenicola TaxID=1536901 RepID=A0ABP9VYL5_9BACT